MERGWKPNVEISPPCPRCGSSNTKFCYYNNYSLTQPRYFCKGCRRYWTKGGSLRNVPVGGGCRKSRRGNKPFRDGTIGIPSRGCIAGGGAAVSLGHVNGTVNSISSAESSFRNGCTLGRAQEEGPNNIDLALVYANFLNQKPDRPGVSYEVDNKGAAAEPNHQLEIPVLIPPNIAVDGGPSFHQFSTIQMMDLMTNQLSQESGGSFVECRSLSDRSSDIHFSDGNAFYFSGLDSIEKHQEATNYQLMSCTATAMNQINSCLLPPLPGEELSTINSEGLVWSGCSGHQSLFPSHTLHASQSSSGLEESQGKDHPNDQLDENRSPFNLSIELCNIFRP